MRRGLVHACLMVVAGSLGAAVADESATPYAPFSTLEQGPWARSALVALATVLDYRSLDRTRPEGPGTARVRVERVFKGTVPAAEFSLLVAGPRPAPDLTGRIRPFAYDAWFTSNGGGRWSRHQSDAGDPSVPYLSPAGGRYVFFLAKRAGGEAHVLEALIDATGSSGEERLQSLEAEVELLRIANPAERAAKTLAHHLATLKATGTWTRIHAARELAHLATVRPDLFDAAVRTRLSTVLAGMGPPQQKTLLRATLRALGQAVLEGDDEEDDAEDEARVPGADPALVERLRQAVLSAGPDRAARRDVLSRFAARAGARGPPVLLAIFRTEAPDVRLAVVSLLADGGVRSALVPLRGAYASDDDPDVRAAIVRAVGLLGGDGDLPWLEERLANPRLKTEVVFALARIRSQRALAVLEAEERRAAASADEEDRSLAERIAHLRTDAFAAAERAAGRRIGPLPE